MTCPICGRKCSTHKSELGTWYWCPGHGLAGLAPDNVAKMRAQQQHDEYIDAYMRSQEANC